MTHRKLSNQELAEDALQSWKKNFGNVSIRDGTFCDWQFDFSKLPSSGTTQSFDEFIQRFNVISDTKITITGKSHLGRTAYGHISLTLHVVWTWFRELYKPDPPTIENCKTFFCFSQTNTG